MATIQVPVTCHRCRGSKQLYGSAVGDLRSDELSKFEQIELLRNGALAAKPCPVCGGTGTTNLQVTR